MGCGRYTSKRKMRKGGKSDQVASTNATYDWLRGLNPKQQNFVYRNTLVTTNPVTKEEQTYGQLFDFFKDPRNREGVVKYLKKTRGKYTPNSRGIDKYLSNAFNNSRSKFLQAARENPEMNLLDSESVNEVYEGNSRGTTPGYTDEQRAAILGTTMEGDAGEYEGSMEDSRIAFNRRGFAKGGKSSIYIKPSKRGTFTAAAKKRGMGVQAFASKVLANKDNYSSAMVKKANFARNASKWKKEDGGRTKYFLGGALGAIGSFLGDNAGTIGNVATSLGSTISTLSNINDAKVEQKPILVKPRVTPFKRIAPSVINRNEQNYAGFLSNRSSTSPVDRGIAFTEMVRGNADALVKEGIAENQFNAQQNENINRINLLNAQQTNVIEQQNLSRYNEILNAQNQAIGAGTQQLLDISANAQGLNQNMKAMILETAKTDPGVIDRLMKQLGYTDRDAFFKALTDPFARLGTGRNIPSTIPATRRRPSGMGITSLPALPSRLEPVN